MQSYPRRVLHDKCKACQICNGCTEDFDKANTVCPVPEEEWKSLRCGETAMDWQQWRNYAWSCKEIKNVKDFKEEEMEKFQGDPTKNQKARSGRLHPISAQFMTKKEFDLHNLPVHSSLVDPEQQGTLEDI